MISKAHEKLDALTCLPWFQNVGGEVNGNVEQVGGWNAAAKQNGSRKWEICRLMARNLLQRKVNERNWNRFEEWNPMVDSIRPEILTLSERVAGTLPIPSEHQKKFGDVLRWNMMLMCFEHAYADIFPPPFYLPLLEPWYAAGHLPCGWAGEEFPDCWEGNLGDGVLIVF